MDKIEKLSLELISKASNYNNWVFGNIKPYLKSPVLEVGSGIGTITKYLLDDYKVFASDINKEYVSLLKKKFSRRKNFIGAKQFDLTKYYKLKKFKTVVCTNVIHHIKDDELAIQNINGYLEKGGIAFVQEPAHQILFGSLDLAQEHCRRYSKQDLANKFERGGFKIKKVFYANSLSAIGWYINSRILHTKEINEKAITLINKIFPLIAFLEQTIPVSFGLSVILIAEKK